MKKLYYVIIGCLLFISKLTIGQDRQPPKVLIMGVPQYIFNHGIRIDIDIASKNHKSWWVLSPQYYINVSDNDGITTRNYEQLHGYGLTIHRKGFLSGKYIDQGVYISGGLGYQHTNILANTERWEEINVDDLKYMQLANSPYNVYIDKVLTEGIIGYQKEITSRLYIDVYAGFGLRYSFHDRPSGSDIKFNKNIFDFGYTGTAFVGGFRIGVGL